MTSIQTDIVNNFIYAMLYCYHSLHNVIIDQIQQETLIKSYESINKYVCKYVRVNMYNIHVVQFDIF